MKRLVNLKEEIEIVEQLQRQADAEGTTLSAIYRRAARLFFVHAAQKRVYPERGRKDRSMSTFDTPFSSTELYILSRLPEIRARIAELRQQRCHLTAGIMRDEALCQIEQWLDPAGLGYRAELQAEQKACAGARALAIDDIAGF